MTAASERQKNRGRQSNFLFIWLCFFLFLVASPLWFLLSSISDVTRILYLYIVCHVEQLIWFVPLFVLVLSVFRCLSLVSRRLYFIRCSFHRNSPFSWF